MRTTALFLLSVALIPFPTPAQTQATEPQKQIHAEDGGMREVLESIYIPTMANAPFTLTLETESTRPLSDGGTITLVNKRQIARDTTGRIYEERWILVPKNGDVHSHRNVIQIADPNNHTLYNCFFEGRHECALLKYSGSTSTVVNVDGPPAGPLPNDKGFVTRESLGNDLVAGVDTVGTRESIVYNPGVLGNDQKLTISREYWFAASLGIDLLSTRTDPRFGTQKFTVMNIDLAEPDSKLFDLPEGFKVVDRRSPETPPAN